MSPLPQEKQLVTKANELVEASYQLSLQEQKIILLLLSYIKPSDLDFNIFRFKVSDFMKAIGLKGKSSYGKKGELQKITRNLLKRDPFEIKDRSGGRTTQINWLASADYLENQGVIELELSRKLIPFLLSLKKRFTSYELGYALNLTKSYSIRLYEILRQYLSIKKRYISLDDLRKMLSLGKKYELYGHIKARIIKPAQKDLETFTDIRFSFEEKKENRKVVGILFHIRNNVPRLISRDIETQALYNRLLLFGVTPDKAAEIVKSTDKKDAVDNIDYVEQQIKKGVAINNVGAYTLKAIEENYKIQPSLWEKENEKTAIAQKEQVLLEQEKQNALKRRLKKIEEIRSNLSNEQLAAYEKQACHEINSEEDKIKHIPQGWINARVDKIIANEAGIPNPE